MKEIIFLANAKSIHSHKWIQNSELRRYKISWISFSNTKYEIDKDISYNLVYSPYKVINFYKQFKSILLLRSKTLKNNSVIVNTHYAGYYGLIGALTLSNSLMTSTWGSDIMINNKNITKSWLLRFILNRSKIITYESDEIYHILINKYNQKNSKLRKVYFGVDTKLFHPQFNNYNYSVSWLDKKNRYVISTRNLEQIYDNSTLIKSVPKLIKMHKDLKIVIAGNGSHHKKLHELATDLRIVESIIFLNGFDYFKLPEILNSCDIYVSCSLYDGGLAASTAEAMACELACVVSDIPANSELLFDKVNCLKFEKQNPEDLANKILELLDDTSLMQRLGKQARADMVEKNDLNTSMLHNSLIYEELFNQEDVI